MVHLSESIFLQGHVASQLFLFSSLILKLYINKYMSWLCNINLIDEWIEIKSISA